MSQPVNDLVPPGVFGATIDMYYSVPEFMPARLAYVGGGGKNETVVVPSFPLASKLL
jgi:hypothetical protein